MTSLSGVEGCVADGIAPISQLAKLQSEEQLTINF
jgi:hypothetical protein